MTALLQDPPTYWMGNPGGVGGGVIRCPLPLLEGGQADSLQALQALVHLQGLGQGLGTSIANAVTGEPVRDGTWVS